MKRQQAEAARVATTIAFVAATYPLVSQPADAASRTLRGRIDAVSLPASTPVERRQSDVLLGITIIGAEALPSDQLAAEYANYLARQFKPSDLTEIANRITQIYREEGYFLSQAVAGPANLTHGIGTIFVYEGRISKVLVEGERPELVTPFLAGLTDAPISRLQDLEQRLARVRQIPGLTITSRIRPDPDDLQAHELILETKFDAGTVYAGLHNWGWEQAGPLQGYATYVRNSFFAPRDQLVLSTFTTPADPREYTQLSLSYALGRQNGDTLRVGIQGSGSGSNDVSRLDRVWGESLSVWGRYERPLRLRRTQSLWFNAGLDAERREHEWGGLGGYSDELRVLRAGLRGLYQDERSNTRYYLGVSRGLDIFGASAGSPEGRSRSDADAVFTKLNFSVSHFRGFGRYFGIYADLNGQLADGALLLSEEYAAGGPDLGRAYRYGEIMGDHGVGGQLELRGGFAPEMDLISYLQGYSYYDWASVWNETDTGWQAQQLSSVGVGVRVTFLEALTARLELGKPLSRTPYDADDRSWRQFFQLAISH